MRILLFLMCIANFVFGSETIMIAISGGSGSGKTTIAQKIHETFPDDSVLICQDYYYKDISDLSLEERAQVNFDHPNSIEFELMLEQLTALKMGEAVSVPRYDFAAYARKCERVTVEPKKIVICEGMLLLAVPEIRELFDLKLYIDTDEDIRLIRRILRDQTERGRTVPSILTQYMTTVRPMHHEYVEPSKRFADLIIPEGGQNEPALDVIIQKLKADMYGNAFCEFIPKPIHLSHESIRASTREAS
ncbi:MAG: uridine kinase [Simkaniaceae bacterium]|nr:uridine kinase [Candidatus Sacchlamyda saccharinae]